MFNTGILSLGVFTNKNSVNIIVWGLETLDRNTWPDVSKEVEGSTEGQVQGNMSLSD